ncbi:MAG: hypothetical protein ACTSQF_12950, partial [Candidatus Heimdallarchaeaceae archaeon]
WYEEETKEGNLWLGWDSGKAYPIDGAAGSEDLYPLNEKMERINFNLIFLVPVVLIIVVKMKRERKSMNIKV